PAMPVFREMPEVDGLVVRAPGEQGAAVIDDGGETDLTQIGIDQDDAQRIQLPPRLLQASLHNLDLFLKLITPRAFRPLEGESLLVEAGLFPTQSGPKLPNLRDTCRAPGHP